MSSLKFGLSTLHALIRSFECFLHIGYKLGIQTWQVRGEKHQEIIKERRTAQNQVLEAVMMTIQPEDSLKTRPFLLGFWKSMKI